MFAPACTFPYTLRRPSIPRICPLQTAMLLALLSDVHGNTRALAHTLDYLAGRGVDLYLQLGDLGPEPLPLFAVLPARHIFGNWEVSGLDQFPPALRPQVAQWPALESGDAWVATHATPAFPSACDTLAATRRYMQAHRPRWMQLFPSLLHDEAAIWAALAALEAQDRLVAFHGHTHVQAVQRLQEDSRLVRMAGPHITLPPGTRTLVGVGSIGVPRDGNRSRCVLFDTAAREIELISVP